MMFQNSYSGSVVTTGVTKTVFFLPKCEFEEQLLFDAPLFSFAISRLYVATYVVTMV